jgi:hypothetical protein
MEIVVVVHDIRLIDARVGVQALHEPIAIYPVLACGCDDVGK